MGEIADAIPGRLPMTKFTGTPSYHEPAMAPFFELLDMW
jgi:hypothetical protein